MLEILHNQMFFTLRGIILKYVPRAIKQVFFYCFWVPVSFVLAFWPYCAICTSLFRKERTVPCNFWSFACLTNQMFVITNQKLPINTLMTICYANYQIHLRQICFAYKNWVGLRIVRLQVFMPGCVDLGEI